ncbi:MAG TPA: hypothetical protein PKA28_06330 [Methylomusa anaerophila]|uniref:Uncharacterized protein n=1 Tax=Methylomusa anaerophila TaxID=1930071 RepID=A0A348ALI9_9FIRM|nr:hypothetical protein [Methylomusa anaerophila]BBB91937.1 hypothetical protein MAMMFC1_02622 [Methylomusa anaerophila]HML88051.1 hypothetical protein [Methylomusa anaerophila]
MAPKSGAKEQMTASRDSCQAGYFLVSGPCDLAEILRKPGQVKEFKGMGEWVPLGPDPGPRCPDPEDDDQYATVDAGENLFGEKITQTLVDIRGELSRLQEDQATRMKDLQEQLAMIQRDSAARKMARSKEDESRQKTVVDLLNLLLGEIRILRQTILQERKNKPADEAGLGSQQLADLLAQVKELKGQLAEVNVTHRQAENEMKIAQAEWIKEMDEREHRLVEFMHSLPVNKGALLQENAWWQKLLGM